MTYCWLFWTGAYQEHSAPQGMCDVMTLLGTKMSACARPTTTCAEVCALALHSQSRKSGWLPRPAANSICVAQLKPYMCPLQPAVKGFPNQLRSVCVAQLKPCMHTSQLPREGFPSWLRRACACQQMSCTHALCSFPGHPWRAWGVVKRRQAGRRAHSLCIHDSRYLVLYRWYSTGPEAAILQTGRKVKEAVTVVGFVRSTVHSSIAAALTKTATSISHFTFLPVWRMASACCFFGASEQDKIAFFSFPHTLSFPAIPLSTSPSSCT